MSNPARPLEQPLPWLAGTWARLWGAHRADRLGHALLFAGPAGVGKRALADLLGRALACGAVTTDGIPCGTCTDCHLAAAGTHPDIERICPDPEAKSHEIKIDQVRELCEREALTPHRAARKVRIIDPADAMNPFAANALLKTLEEPVSSTLLLLISEDPTRLPATVRSRCQPVRFTIPPRASALDWLRGRLPGSADAAHLLGLAHGAPLAALALANSDWPQRRAQCLDDFIGVGLGRRDPIAVADGWQSQDPALVLDAVAGWVFDLLRPRAAADSGQDAALRGLAAKVDPKSGHRYLRRVVGARGLVGQPLNRLLLYEGLLVRWARLAQGQDLDGC